MLNTFRMLIHPSSGACDVFFEFFHGLYCSGSMCVGVTVWFGWDGVVWYSDAGWRTSASPASSQTTTWQQHASYQSNTTHEITQHISLKLLRMDVLISETCWTWNDEIKSKWHQVVLSLFDYQDNARFNNHKGMYFCVSIAIMFTRTSPYVMV